MLKEAKIKKVKQLVFMVTMEEEDKNGMLSILTKLRDHKPRVSTRTSVSMSTDHSTLSQNSHSTELLSATVPTTFGREDGELTPRLNNGTSMVSQRPSRTTTGSHTHLISNPTVDQPTSDVPLPTQDGGKSGETKVVSLSMRKERYLRFKTKKTTLIWNQETFKLETEEKTSDNNGKSYMSMNTLSQRRVS
jgi:hypothetical protein